MQLLLIAAIIVLAAGVAIVTGSRARERRAVRVPVRDRRNHDRHIHDRGGRDHPHR